eukprot:scaffold16447_cov116-Isochrysis_galbana.AAC.3
MHPRCRCEHNLERRGRGGDDLNVLVRSSLHACFSFSELATAGIKDERVRRLGLGLGGGHGGQVHLIKQPRDAGVQQRNPDLPALAAWPAVSWHSSLLDGRVMQPRRAAMPAAGTGLSRTGRVIQLVEQSIGRPRRLGQLRKTRGATAEEFGL